MILLKLLFASIFYQSSNCKLWPKGVVRFYIDKNDYDPHSSLEITSTLEKIEKEICVKFFKSSPNAAASEMSLYISNPARLQQCPKEYYDFQPYNVKLTIGYKCLNKYDITRIVVDMLKASIQGNDKNAANEFVTTASDKRENQTDLLSRKDRNFINTHYADECRKLNDPLPLGLIYRRSYDDVSFNGSLSKENLKFYGKKIWPMGIVLYGVADELRNTSNYQILKHAMTTIELGSCVVFAEREVGDQVLNPKHLLWFTDSGEDQPELGYKEGRQTINLRAMTQGARAHTAHTAVNLMRAIGVPMASNRHDRSNHVIVHWDRITKGKENLFMRMPENAWIRHLGYDYNSITHAPANYMCGQRCNMGEQTVEPLQDHLWTRTLNMGHVTELSDSDSEILRLLYTDECAKRLESNRGNWLLQE